MTGDSDNEVGAGESPVPTEAPEPRGEPAYRPFRGWAMAEPKPPSLWSRMRSALGGLFARKPKEAAAEADEASLLAEHGEIGDEEGDAGPSALEEMDVEWKDEGEPKSAATDDAFFYPEPAPEPQASQSPAQPIAELEPEAPLAEHAPEPEAEPEPEVEAEPEIAAAAEPQPEMRAEAEPVAETPWEAAVEPRRTTPTDWLERVEHAHVEDTSAPAEPPIYEAQQPAGEDDFQPVMRVLKEERPGFFARLFGRKGKQKAALEPALEPAPEAALEPAPEPAPEPALEAALDALEGPPSVPPFALRLAPELAPPSAVSEDLPLITEFEQAEPAPTLDDVLPMDVSSTTYDQPSQPTEIPVGEEAAEPWMAAREPEKKRGFFARLFGRKKKEPEPEPEPQLETEPEYVSGIETVPATHDAEEFAPTPDAFAAFEEDAQVPGEQSRETFASVEDALPLDTTFAEPAPTVEMEATLSEPTPIALPFALPFARTLEPEAEPAPPAPVAQEAEPFFFDAPAPPATFGMDIGAEAASEGRDTVEVAPERTTDEMAVVEETTGEMVPPPVPEVTAQAEAERPPFFVPKFRAFYNEIVHYKQQKSEFTAGFSTAIVDYHADLSADSAAQTLSMRLQQILELQAAEATWMGGEAAARFPDAQYAMAVLADELFTHLDWPGKEAWPRFLIEPRMYKSLAADVEFFKRVDKLLKNEVENPSPAAKDLARMYLLILAAGFQGKYRPFHLPRALAEYRRRLYEFVYGKDALMLYGDDRRLFPETVERTVAGRAVSRFSMLQQWAAVLVLLLIGYAVVSQIAWNRVSAELKDVTARVERANASSTSDGVDAPVQR